MLPGGWGEGRRTGLLRNEIRSRPWKKEPEALLQPQLSPHLVLVLCGRSLGPSPGWASALLSVHQQGSHLCPWEQSDGVKAQTLASR